MEEKLKKLFEEKCIIEKEGKRYLNELGGIVITFIAISMLKKIYKKLEIEEIEDKKENGN